jgi:F-type H+-transporting ATPase subunit delta
MAEASQQTTGFAEPIDVDAQSLAAEYAKALFAAAEKAGALDTVVEQLAAVAATIVKHPRVADVLASSMFSPEHKIAMIDKAFAKKAHPLITKFLKVIASHQRAHVVRPIQQELQRMYDKARNRIPVRVVTAAALGEAQKKNVAAKMKTALGGEPILQTEVDPNLIGGLVVQVGDVVFDGSLASNLARLREQLINRSVHEIQRRRDSVRTSS